MDIEKIIRNGNPWPLKDILKKLIEGNKILLNDKSYDGNGWEFLSQAIDQANEVIDYIDGNHEKIKPSSPSHPSNLYGSASSTTTNWDW